MTYSIPDKNLDNYDRMLSEGRIIRGRWTADDGRELACALAALSPEIAKAESSDACPATFMPTWLADVIPDINDNVSDAAWIPTLRRLGATLRKIDTITDEQWDLVRRRHLARCLAIVRAAITVDNQGVIDAIDGISHLLRVEGTDEEWQGAFDCATRAATYAPSFAAAAVAAATVAAAEVAVATDVHGAPAVAGAISYALTDADAAVWDHFATGLLDDLDACIAGTKLSTWPTV